MQAIFNLVQNAAEALAAEAADQPGGRAKGNIWITAERRGERVALTVRDDGAGMDAGTLARCTEPFFTTKPRDRGTGLGLALVRTAVERHGGQLLADSSPGEGSAFTLLLPAAD